MDKFKSRKIAILLPDLRGGGAERISVNLANELAARGYSVDVVLLRAEGEFLELLASGINVVDFNVKKFRFGFIPLVKYLFREKPSAMLACMWPLTIMAVAAKLLSRSKSVMVVAEHVTWSKGLINFSGIEKKLVPMSMNLLFRYSDGIIAVSNGAADDFAEYTGLARAEITTIYNPVVDSKSYELKHSLDLVNSLWARANTRILTVGNLKEQKNHALLINAFQIVCQTHDVCLLILGEGHLRVQIEELVKKLSLEDRVIMPGFAVDTRPYYQHADLFVLSSDWEGLPTVLIEAIAAGTPVVSTDCPSGPREILCDGVFGELVPMNNPEKLAESIIDSISKKHDTNALKQRANDFSIKSATDKYLKLLLP